MDNPENKSLEMLISEIKFHPKEGSYQPVEMVTSRGTIDCRYYPVVGTNSAAVWVPGAGGGWGSPARGLYEQMCETLVQDQIASLRVRYRYPNHLLECVLDTLAGLAFLHNEGIDMAALIGHSFGGAVVIGAAAASSLVRTVIPMSTQSYGIDPVTKLAENCSILLIHGKADNVLSPRCSEYTYQLAHEPKKLILYENAGHGLDAVRAELIPLLRNWLIQELRSPEISSE
jgi:pimeloyl-ACP methyl ester carboxylesterase